MKRYETFMKSGERYYYIGWYPMIDENQCVSTKTRKQKIKNFNCETRKWEDTTKTWIYKTYKSGFTYKYGSFIEEEERK